MNAEPDFLPITGETEVFGCTSPFQAIGWLLFVLLLLASPAVVIAAYRVLL